ncbi:hypothetical protein ACFORJ_13040 [Corynebacterium hansenii]|uniref:Secreted protein n=1 Tax=Corynebacterium hansenii TaxID=394964 RepID=A0ABV7ZRE8_9CORY|nr:hypothetical protein [Corynebacterium hansenii]WJY99641.1 hypothetical protein CHAN_05095 [Corynebacterium hansenii]
MARADEDPLDDDDRGTGSARMSPALRGTIIVVALLAVIAVSVAVTVAVLRGGDGGEGKASETSATAPTSDTGDPPPETESTEEAPAVDSAAMLEGAGFDVVMSGPAPEAVDTWGGYRRERSTNGRVRVFEGQEASQATLDGGQWPMSMNSCGAAMYLVVFRAANDNVSLNASLINSVRDVVASERTSRGWMLLTNCATPQWEFLSSSDVSNLGDVVYDVHEYRQSASAPGAGAGAGAQPAAAPTVVRCIEGTPGPAEYSDGSVGFARECVETPEAQRALMGERCCGGLYGRQECGEELWQDLCNSGPPG